MWSSPPEILLSEDEIYVILHRDNSLARFSLQDNLIKVYLKLTGSCGLVMAQVISVEIKMNIFFDLKLSISSVRADCEGRQNKQLEGEAVKRCFFLLDCWVTSDKRTWECPRGLINLLLHCAFWDVVHHHIALHQALEKLFSSRRLPTKNLLSRITGLRLYPTQEDWTTATIWHFSHFK